MDLYKLEFIKGKRYGAIIKNDESIGIIGFGTCIGQKAPRKVIGHNSRLFKFIDVPCSGIELDNGITIFTCECDCIEEEDIMKLQCQLWELEGKDIHPISVKKLRNKK